jgi:glycogen(starch) synthase
MRVLLTTDTVGGVWTFTCELATGLLARGHAVALVSFGRKPLPHQATWAERIQGQYRDRFRYIASATPLEWMKDNRAAYSSGEGLLLDHFETFAPDIFHTSQFCFGALPLSIPKLITAHSDVVSWAAACRPNGLEPSTWLTQYLALVQKGLHEADAVVAPTRWMLKALGKHFDISSANRVILNGRTLRDASTLEPRTMQAISVGRFWDEAKNLSLLAEVRSPMPIVIAGQQSSVETPSLGRIRTLGVLDQQSLSAVLSTSTLYIAPSLYEPFGLAPLEAALCGCAVLANDLPSFREVWGDAAVYFHDAPSLTRLLHHLNDSPDALVSARSRAHARALELSADRMTEAYLALYRDLLEQRSRAITYPRELAARAC